MRTGCNDRGRARVVIVLATLLLAGGGATLWWSGHLGGGGKGTPLEIDAGVLRMTAVFAPDPPEPGTNTLELTVRGKDGTPVEGAEIQAVGTMTSMAAMAEMRASADVEALGGGRYRLTLDLPMAGGWPLTLHVQSPDGREASIELGLQDRDPRPARGGLGRRREFRGR